MKWEKLSEFLKNNKIKDLSIDYIWELDENEDSNSHITNLEKFYWFTETKDGSITLVNFATDKVATKRLEDFTGNWLIKRVPKFASNKL